MSICVENHPFDPVLPACATALMMGTMPPTRDKWCMPFHYPNFNNDMWRIYGKVFFDDVDYFRVGTEKRFDHHKIKRFLHKVGIGECPTVTQVIRQKGNAADSHLSVVSTVNLKNILSLVPQVEWLFTTGGKATEILIELINQDSTQPRLSLPKVNQCCAAKIDGRQLTICRLPSSSRAYPQTLEKKIAAYQAFFYRAGLLPSTFDQKAP
ncbi:MAG: DNA glycosylase [Moraxella sp.]|nr:DNA glycosylase [Moraxella sp.]